MSTFDPFGSSIAAPAHPPIQPGSLGQTTAECPPETSGIYRQGRKLFLPREDWALLPTGRRIEPAVYRALPDRCVCCAAPVDEGDRGVGGRRIKRRMSWHHPALFLTVLIGLLPYAIIALCCRQTAIVYLPLCRRHLRRRRIALAITCTLLAAAFLFLVVGAALESEPLLAAMGLTFLITILWAIPASRIAAILMPYRIDFRGVVLSGASRKYLDTLPERSRGGTMVLPPRCPPTAQAA